MPVLPENNQASPVSAADLHKEATLQFRNGNLTRALENYTRICTLDPDDVQAWHMRGAISGMLGDFSAAAHCCEKAISLKPDAAGIYANYGNALMELQRHDDALAAFRKAVEIDAPDSQCLNNMGTLYRKLGREMEAEACYRQAIEVSPGLVEAYCNLALLLKDTGRYVESVRVCRQILSSDRNNSLAHGLILDCLLDREAFTLALGSFDITSLSGSRTIDHLYRIVRRLHGQDRFAEATQVVEKALPAIPDDRRFRVLLARCLIRTGSGDAATAILEGLGQAELSFDELMLVSEAWLSANDDEYAEACLRRASNLCPDEALPAVRLSRIALNRGDCKQAISELETFLAEHPGSAEALTELAYIHYLSGDYARAIKYDRQAIDANPDCALAQNNLGTVYQECGREAEAEACFREAIRLDPGLLSAQCNLGHRYCTLHQYDKSVRCYDEILERHPAHADALTGKAVVLERMGEAETAFGLVAPLVEAGSRNAYTLLAYARSSNKAGKENIAIELLENALDDPSVSLHNKIQMNFLLGKLYDRKGDYDHAFSRFKAGNELTPRRFDRTVHRESVVAIIAAFSPERIADYPRSSNASRKPVFIVGMPRSGTSLVEQILSAHPDLHGAGELTHIPNIASSLKKITRSEKDFPDNLDRLTTGILDQLAVSYLRQVEPYARDALRITDKLPSNFRLLGLIELLFPNARVIHCTRDPRDTCLSCYFQQFKRGQYFASNLSDTAHYYNAYLDLMRHWKSVLGLPIFVVNYEEMVANQEEVSRNLLEFIGLDWHPDCLDFHQSGRQVITASYDQVRRPLYTSSAGRWKNYRTHLDEMLSILDIDNGQGNPPGPD